MPKSAKRPAYTLHKTTGQARVRIDGRDHYLGAYGSPESRERYDELITEWLARQDVGRVTLTVDDLALLYLDHADGYYRKGGEPTGEINNIRIALRHLVKAHGRTRVRDFGPVALKEVRQSMIDAGYVRTSINLHVGRIKRLFKWGVENESVPVAVWQALCAVPGLRKGRSKAKESAGVKPVPEAFVNAIEPHVSRQVWAMVQLQLLTGMRPGEVLAMRGRDLNMAGRVWEYVPDSHKTEHHGKARVVFLGPRAQAVVREFLKPDLTAYLFSPADARAEYVASKYREGARPARKGKRTPGQRYTSCTYANAIQKACRKAGVPHWHPHRLRHNAATVIRREAGLDTARTVLGHASLSVTEIYAEKDAAAAREIMSRLG